MTASERFIRGLPKTDLHVHLEGTIEPDLMLALAQRNGISLRSSDPDAMRAAYDFQDLRSFLDLYFEGCKVLIRREDFHDITFAYLRRAAEDGVIRAEMFIGPQSFTERGVPLPALMDGVLSAMEEASAAFGIGSGLLISVHRHRSEAEAMEVLASIAPWRDRVLGIGMGGAEVGNPPSKFARFFLAARAAGYRIVVHAGEEGPAAYVREALEVLRVDRIDHGIACMDDPALVQDLVRARVPLTVCPLSNVRLKCVPSMAAHPLKRMLAAGLFVTVNSDDPPYFGGYVSENLIACQRDLGLSASDLARLARNGLEAAFWPPDEAAEGIARLERYLTGAAI